MPVLEIYSSIECPYAYLATYRLRQVGPEFAGQVQVVWRALSLEYINRRIVTSPPMFAAEKELFAHIEPALPWNLWTRPEWDWPVTLWPAFEALACAQVQNAAAAWEMSWALRHAFFAEGRNISMRHEILALAADVGGLDLAQFEADWDNGRYKQNVIAESRRGWHELKVNGSATFVLPDGHQMTNPALGEIDFDEENYVLRSYTPYEGDPLAVYREMINSVKRKT
ncbi:MAG: DsbA family protein [Chloroflexi bacterium]|jgi:predicted DsbA family dithiol-disulfide isomerase|nr:DsbA family protein [Chloroflexota bacterium]